jgi:hypothetical protein
MRMVYRDGAIIQSPLDYCEESRQSGDGARLDKDVRRARLKATHLVPSAGLYDATLRAIELQLGRRTPVL